MKNTYPALTAYIKVMAVLLILAGYGYYKYWNVATVNGVGISRLEYIKTMEKAGGKQTLDQMVQETLILEEGRKNNIVMDRAAIDAELLKVEERIKAQGQTLDAALAMSGMTKTDLERQILMQKIQTTLAANKTEVTQTQIDEFIKTYKAELPPKGTKAELETIAKEELNAQAAKLAAEAWLAELTKNAKVVTK